MARALILIFTLFLTGCSTYMQAPPNTGVNGAPSNEFTASGKLGIRSDEVNESARFNWIQQGNDYEIELLDPFGRQVMDLVGETGQVVLRSTNQPQPQVARTPEELMQQLLGWQVPVAPARYWIQGHPAPGIAFETAGLNQFNQLGWQIDILTLQQTPEGLSLPRKVRLSHEDLRLTLIISNWQFNPAI